MKISPFKSMREAEDVVVPTVIVGTAAGIVLGAVVGAANLALDMAKLPPEQQLWGDTASSFEKDSTPAGRAQQMLLGERPGAVIVQGNSIHLILGDEKK